MVARVGTYEGTAERLDEFVRGFEQSRDAVSELEGFEGAYLLVDRATGSAMTVALWSTSAAAEASAERVGQLRAEAAELSEYAVTGVETYDVPARI
jgi:heme-degrading monooxygenase HmoA